MTGGKRRREMVELALEGPTWARWQPPPPLPSEVEAEQVIEWWKRAATLRESVTALLRSHELTFTEWRMLHAAETLVRETGDMVSQLQIRRRAYVDTATASRFALRLTQRGWLDCGPDYYGFAYRIFATEKATAMLRETRPRVVELGRIARGDAGSASR